MVSSDDKSLSSRAKTLSSRPPHNHIRVAIEEGEQIAVRKWRVLGMSFDHRLLVAVTHARLPYARREENLSDDAVRDGGTDACTDDTRSR